MPICSLIPRPLSPPNNSLVTIAYIPQPSKGVTNIMYNTISIGNEMVFNWLLVILLLHTFYVLNPLTVHLGNDKFSQ